MANVKFKLAAGTNAGLLRQNNEDNFIVNPDLSLSQWMMPKDNSYVDLSPYGALLVVADGMGGMNAGEVASAMAVETIQQMFTPEALAPVVDDSKAIQEFMETVVKTADLNILNRSQTDSSTQGMGTTVVMAWILGNRAYVCWCGDSRCYIYNHRQGLKPFSKDHSLVQELVDKGELRPEYAHDYPLSNVITRCLGNEENRARPDTKVYELHNGDVIMLCSDGLSGLCTDEEMEAVVEEFHESPADLRNELISAALSRGGHDNVTVAVCTIQTDEPDEPSDMSDDQQAAEHQDGDKSVADAVNDGQAEELATTLRNEPIRNSHGCRNTFLILLIIILLAGVCIYFLADHEEVNQYVQQFLTKIKKLIK